MDYGVGKAWTSKFHMHHGDLVSHAKAEEKNVLHFPMPDFFRLILEMYLRNPSNPGTALLTRSAVCSI